MKLGFWSQSLVVVVDQLVMVSDHMVCINCLTVCSLY